MDREQKIAMAELVAGILLGQAAMLNMLMQKGLLKEEEVAAQLNRVAKTKRDEGASEQALAPIEGLITYLFGREPILN